MRGLLDKLIALVEADSAATDERAVVVFLGDLVNRSLLSRQVIDRLIEGRGRNGDRWTTLQGNHDQLLLDAVSGKSDTAFARSRRARLSRAPRKPITHFPCSKIFFSKDLARLRAAIGFESARSSVG